MTNARTIPLILYPGRIDGAQVIRIGPPGYVTVQREDGTFHCVPAPVCACEPVGVIGSLFDTRE